MKKIEAKKKFGQNFLKDSQIKRKIIQSMPHNKNYIVEIGPGLGDLTNELVKYKDMTAYEIDVDMIHELSTKFSKEINDEKLKIVQTDVLDVWEKNGTLHDSKYDLIANLPYYVATNIILRALEDDNCANLIVMIQKEVALKFSAKEGEKEFSSLGVISSVLCNNKEILFDVPPEAFDPAPKVTSSVIFLRKNGDKIEEGFKKFLKVAFSQPRKKLIKNLNMYSNNCDLKEIFSNLEIEENKRPHEISPSLYRQMYKKVIINGRDNNE